MYAIPSSPMPPNSFVANDVDESTDENSMAGLAKRVSAYLARVVGALADFEDQLLCEAGFFAREEHLETHIKTFDATSNTGVLDMIATGMVPMSCTDKKFTKSGQLIAVNVSDCVDPQVTVGDIKYCSDQDVSLLTMSYAGIPLTATLTREASP